MYISSSVSSSFEMEFTSYYKAYQHEYICVANSDEFNYSTNPTLYDDSGAIKNELISNTEFSTYITGIGLYDDSGNLVALGKLAKPLKKEKTFNSIYTVKFDV